MPEKIPFGLHRPHCDFLQRLPKRKYTGCGSDAVAIETGRHQIRGLIMKQEASALKEEEKELRFKYLSTLSDKIS